jgi:hypothetical protein
MPGSKEALMHDMNLYIFGVVTLMVCIAVLMKA